MISDDSSRQGSFRTAWAAASTPTHTAESRASVTTSSSGVGATSWKNDTAKAMSASVARASRASRYMETRPSTAKTRFHSEVKVAIT